MSNNSKLNHDFLKQYSAVFADKLLQKAYQNKSHLTGKDILNLSSIKQLNLFVIKAFFIEWQEEVRKLESPLFDYQNKEVRKAMIGFMNTLSQHIHISQKHLKPYVEKALKETMLLTFDPVSYLISAFGDNKSVRLSQKQIKPLMKYLISYKDTFQEYLESVEGDSVREALGKAEIYFEDFETDASFEELVDMLSKYLVVTTPELVMPSFQPRITHADPQEDAWETEDWEEENDEKDEPQTELQTSSSEYFGAQMHEEESPIEVVEDQETTQWDEEDESEAAERFESDDADEYDTEDESEPEEEDWDNEELEESNHHEEEAKVDQINDLDDEQEDSHSDYSHVVVQKEEDEEDEETLNSQYGVPQKTLAEAHAEKGVNSVFDAISINHRYMFLQELFDGDNELFTAALKEVDDCDTFDEAVEMLVQSYAKEFFWDMNSEEVKELLKVIYRKFRG